MDEIEIKIEDQSDLISSHQCVLCDQLFQTEKNLRDHFKWDHQTNNKLECWCGTTFKAQGALTRHVKIVHENHKIHKCDDCQKKFSSPSDLKRHVNGVHQNVKEFQCEMCSKSFSQRNNLLRHQIEVHVENFPSYGCEYCNKDFKTKGSLAWHTKRVHDKIRKYRCSVCNKHFVSPSELKRHSLAIHNDDGQIFPSGLCSVEMDYDEDDMEKPLINHDHRYKPTLCELCGQDFAQVGHLTTHKNRVHGEGQGAQSQVKQEQGSSSLEFRCKICDIDYVTRLNLKVHVENTHQTKHFICDVCNKSFPRDYSLQRHIKSVHEDVKPFECDFCCKRFADKNHFSRHAQICLEKSSFLIIEDKS